jgi:ATP-dependent Lon protease
MSNGTSPARDTLDGKANQLFAGKVVRKDLVRKVKVGANVPVFVLEFLLGKYCASSDELAIQMGLQVVNDTLANNYIRPDEAHPAVPGWSICSMRVPCAGDQRRAEGTWDG